mgnify:CR=1 FL=1
MKLKFLFCAAAAFLSAGCNDEDGSGDFGNLKISRYRGVGSDF